MSEGPQEEENELARTCEYVCDGTEWVLAGGTAPEGYYCPDVIGGCDDFGDTAVVQPVPNPDPPAAFSASTDSQISNSGVYRFEQGTDTLYFARGRAEKGYGLLSKISMSELRERFPAVAAEVELLKNAKSLSSFNVVVPAVLRPSRKKPRQ